MYVQHIIYIVLTRLYLYYNMYSAVYTYNILYLYMYIYTIYIIYQRRQYMWSDYLRRISIAPGHAESCAPSKYIYLSVVRVLYYTINTRALPLSYCSIFLTAYCNNGIIYTYTSALPLLYIDDDENILLRKYKSSSSLSL